MPVLLLFVFVASGQTYPYVSNPPEGSYTTCGSGTRTDVAFTSSCTFTSPSVSYDCSNVKVGYWGYDEDNDRHVFRIKKCSGYFNYNSSGRIVIRTTSDEIQCTNYYINNSSTSYVEAYFDGHFYGANTFLAYLTTTNYQAYAGSVTVTLQHGTPLANTSPAYNITENSATLRGAVNPNGLTTHYYFEYGTTSSYGYTTSTSSLSSSYSVNNVTKSIYSLNPGTTYHYRLVAYNSDGTDYGQDRTFTTAQNTDAPVATTQNATNVTESSATLHGSVTPNGLSTSYEFQYGTSTGYGQTSSSGSVSGSNSSTAVSRTITGLSPNTTYHFRLVAENDLGYDLGGDRTFTTSPVSCQWSDCTSGSCGSTQYLSAAEKMEAAQYLCQHNIIDNGTCGQPLRPDDYITRAELAKIAFFGLYNGEYNVQPSLVSDYIPSPYTDLQDAGTFYYRAAKALLYLQYHDDATGTTPFDRDRAYFNPNGTITRRLMLKVLMETFNIAPYTGYSTASPFSDFSASDDFWGYARKAYDLGITNTSVFRPYDDCTRAEAFVFLYRILTSPNIQISTPNNSSDPYTSDFFIPNNLSPAALSAIGGIEYGNYEYYSKGCFSYPGWVNMDFGFTYNSYLTEMPEDYYPLTPLGHRAWSHTYNQYLNIIYDPYSGHDFLLFHLAEGNILMYENTGVTFKKLTVGNYDTLETIGSNIYTLTTPNQVTFTYEKLVSSKPIYYLTSIQNRFGDGIDISYEPSEATGYRRVSEVSSGNWDGMRSLQFYYLSGSDNLRLVTDPDNRSIYFSYSNGKLHQFTDAKNNTTTYYYGSLDMEKDLLKDVEMPNGNIVHNNYERRKLRSTQTNNNTATIITQSVTQSNNVITYNSEVTEHVQGNQNLTTHYLMNDLGKITHVYDDCNVDMTYNYTNADHKALPSSISNNKTGITSTYEYSHKGLVKQRTTTASGISQTENWQYNFRNDISQYTDANNHTTYYEYDNSGALEEIRDPLNHVTSITNNAHGQPYRVENPTGITFQYLYTSRGLVRDMSILGTGLSQSYTYDVVGRTISATDYNGNTTHYSYDNNDNLTEITDALNHTTTLIYDVNDNLTNIINALGHSTILTYNENDLCTSQSFGGHTRHFTYNTDGSLHTIVSPSGQTRTFSYNSSGDVTNDGYATYSYLSNSLLGSVSKDNKAISYNYDALGRATSVAYDGKTVGYTYDNAGNILTIIYPGNKTVTYTYDAANRMTSVKDWNNHTTTYHYRDDDQLDYVQYPNYVRTTYSYDNAGRRIGQVTKRNSGNGSIIAQYSYDLDDNGNHEYENIIEPYTTLPNMTNQNLTYHYGADNRLQYVGNTTFTYDNNGNTVSKTGRTLGYDICDNLTSVSGDFNATYTYDGLGNRRSATRNGVTTKYVLDILQENANVLMETNNSGTVQNYYIYGADGLVSRIGADGTTTHYYVADHRGSVVAMVNSSSSANVTHRYQYDEFGNVLQSEEADSNPFRYVGKYGLMYETGDLYFVRARYYDPSIGRFLSEDPIWATNLYPYAGNNPMGYIDPSGNKYFEAVRIYIANSKPIVNKESPIPLSLQKIDYLTSKISLIEDFFKLFGKDLGKIGDATAILSILVEGKKAIIYFNKKDYLGVFTSIFSMLPGVSMEPEYTRPIIESFRNGINISKSKIDRKRIYFPAKYHK